MAAHGGRNPSRRKALRLQENMSEHMWRLGRVLGKGVGTWRKPSHLSRAFKPIHTTARFVLAQTIPLGVVWANFGWPRRRNASWRHKQFYIRAGLAVRSRLINQPWPDGQVFETLKNTSLNLISGGTQSSGHSAPRRTHTQYNV